MNPILCHRQQVFVFACWQTFQLSIKRETTYTHFLGIHFNIITLQITCVWFMIQSILWSHQSCQDWWMGDRWIERVQDRRKTDLYTGTNWSISMNVHTLLLCTVINRYLQLRWILMYSTKIIEKIPSCLLPNFRWNSLVSTYTLHVIFSSMHLYNKQLISIHMNSKSSTK